MKTLLILPLLLILVSGIGLAYAQVTSLEFSESTTFINGEFVGIYISGVNFDSSSIATGIILNEAGKQMDSFNFEIQRWTDVGDRGSVRIETNNANYQTGELYTVKSNYQGNESEIQFTLTAPPPTMEELAVMVQSQQLQSNPELEALQIENMELKQEISRLNGIIETLEKQIQTMTDEFFVTVQNQFDWFRTQINN